MWREGWILVVGRVLPTSNWLKYLLSVLTVGAVRVHSALAIAKSFSRPTQSARAVLHVIATFFVVIALPNFGWTSA